METKQFKGDLKVSPSSAQPNLSAVMAFRVTKRAADTKDTCLTAKAIVGVRSRNGLARELVLVLLAEPLTYRNPEDAKVDSRFLDRAENQSPAAAN